ncbi:MAG: InlB B-repeat-containing protein, partial [Clostridia bacterium]|nr:InlB B-repeat-containing protein [Clostridia bacterium]
MVQTKRKTNVIALAIVLSLVFVFALSAVLFATPATDTAYAIDDVAQFHFYGISGTGSKTDGGITFNYSGSYYVPGGTSCIVLDAGQSFTLTVSNSALQNKNITKVKYSLTEDYASGAGTGTISAKLMRGSTTKATGTSKSSGVDISGSGNLTFTITNSNKSDRSKAYRFSTNFTLMAPSQVAVTVGAGTGVKEVFLSSAQSGSPVAASGSKFAENTTVYAFAKLAKGYQAQSGWGLVSGNENSEDAVYRTGSKKITTSSKDFGTINAAIKTRTIALNGNGIENDTSITLVYDQANSAGALVRDGYYFLGWNTNAEGTGTPYGNSEGASLTSEQVNTILDDASITAFYAMWRADKNTVIALIEAIGDVEYTQACKDKIDEARNAYGFLSPEDQALVTNYSDLEAAEAIYGGMQSDKEALDTYKTEKKGVADGLAEAGDSAACEDLIAEAKTDIDAVVYDCTKTLDENKAVVDAILADLADALALQRDNEAADAVDALIDAIGNPVTLADKDAINAAREAYDVLTPAQKALVDDLADLEDAEATYSELEAAYHAARALVGDGSLENPYLIERVEQLEHFRDIVLGANGETQNSEACVVLTADIDLGGSVDNVWTPIGGQNSLAYLGTFDGRGHTITGLYASGENTIGLFGRVNGGGVVKNLTVYGTAIATNTGNYQGGVAGIVGYLNGSVINCHNYVIVTATNEGRWKGYAAGIVGQMVSENAVVSNCSNYGTIYSNSATVGGIVAQIYDGTVTNCYNFASVTGTEYVGGIVGSAGSSSTVSYCFNYGAVNATSQAPAGGVAGYSVPGGSGAATFGANYYLTGRLTVNSVAQNGGICAYNETTEDWDYKDIEGQLEPLTENKMRDQASFVGWDFDDVWTMGNDHPVFYDSGIRICGSIVDNFVTSGEGWSFDKATKTLTLTDFRFEGDGAIFDGNKNAVIFYQGTEGLNIVLVGENIIENTFDDDQKNIYGIYSNATLTIGGEGSLDVSVTGKGGHTFAIGSMSTLTLDAAAITATGGPARFNSIGLYANYDGILINSGAVTATGGTSDNNYSYGIWSYGADASSGTAGTVIAKEVESVTAKGDTMAICWGVNTEIGGLGVEYDDQIASETEILPDNYVYSSSPIEGIFRLQEIRLIGITVDDVIALINAIPDPVVYTQDCKDAIDEARKAYETLGTDEKILVTNYDDLTDAESIYNGMQSDKESLDLYKDTKKGEADDLALEGDSPACTDLISDAKDAIDALSYDCTKTLDENKAIIDGIIADLANALALQRDKEAFEAYKVPSKEAADELALEGDSAACTDLISDAKDAIDALNYDEEKALAENKAIIDGIIADLADALALQRNKEAFEAYKV